MWLTTFVQEMPTSQANNYEKGIQMAHQELYKKHRPKSLKRILGNTSTVAALRTMLERDTLPHTILFHGPAGCGKTSLARILASELDCHEADLLEINAASFRGIDSIRDMERQMLLAPLGECRIWILDECHQWSKDAQNAALKMLEDTPDHVYFFLCTTDPQRLIKAIQRRCCELPVKTLTDEQIVKLLKRVMKKEKFQIADNVLEQILDLADGSPAIALVILDKISNLEPSEQEAAIVETAAEQTEAIDLCRALIKGSPWKAVAKIVKELEADPESVRYAVLGYARQVLLGNSKPDQRAYNIIVSFADHFYDSKAAGLAAACYEVVFGEA